MNNTVDCVAFVHSKSSGVGPYPHSVECFCSPFLRRLSSRGTRKDVEVKRGGRCGEGRC